jgi:Zn-dependent peptidase ImmA (M78 family)
MSNATLQSSDIVYHPPIPSRVSKANVWAFAEKLRVSAGLKNGFELAELVAQNDGAISYIDFFDGDQTDAIVVEPDGTFRIRLSSQTGALRDNFTIAHELGHLVLHWPKVEKMHPGHGMRATRRVDEENKDLERCEWEANWFASAFLMPAEEFKVAYADGIASDVFGVTSAAVEVRARTLGLND